MDKISRRRFIRDASIGAAALGTAAAVRHEALSKLGRPAAGAAASATSLRQAKSQGPLATKDEVMAHVIGGPSGKVEIYSGTRLVTIHDRSVADTLLSAVS